jgi:DNA (cytosine-5)-methyltransferase 1
MVYFTMPQPPSSRSSPRLLDLFCGDGGASKGYLDAGFTVTGVDIRPTTHPIHPRFTFVQADAFQYLVANHLKFDAVHASPPCRPFTRLRTFHPDKTYFDFLPETRGLLTLINQARASLPSPSPLSPQLPPLPLPQLPYVIENVETAPLLDPIMLCGAMFGLRTYRHRLFESNFSIIQPRHPTHLAPSAEPGRDPQPHEFMSIAGHFSNLPLARRIMGMPWASRRGIANAIPPVYTRYIGQQLLHHMTFQ